MACMLPEARVLPPQVATGTVHPLHSSLPLCQQTDRMTCMLARGACAAAAVVDRGGVLAAQERDAAARGARGGRRAARA